MRIYTQRIIQTTKIQERARQWKREVGWQAASLSFLTYSVTVIGICDRDRHHVLALKLTIGKLMSTLLSRYGSGEWERARLHTARGRGTAREGREWKERDREKKEGERERDAGLTWQTMPCRQEKTRSNVRAVRDRRKDSRYTRESNKVFGAYSRSHVSNNCVVEVLNVVVTDEGVTWRAERENTTRGHALRSVRVSSTEKQHPAFLSVLELSSCRFTK